MHLSGYSNGQRHVKKHLTPWIHEKHHNRRAALEFWLAAMQLPTLTASTCKKALRLTT
jgi:hypothetical protein